MKKISARGMDPKEHRCVTGNLLGSGGNDNIRGCHIDYFEKRVVEEKEHKTHNLAIAPNYYAWLCLMTEHVFWEMRHFCYRYKELKSENLDLSYDKLRDTFLETCGEFGAFSDNDLLSLRGLINKILTLRHALIHRGFPNLLPTIVENLLRKSKRSKKNSSGESVDVSTQEIIGWYANPQNFDKSREEFDSFFEAMSKAPGLQVDLGFMGISYGIELPKK